ncbi:MAG: VWA domain-containing protein [Bacteroidota bacterium]
MSILKMKPQSLGLIVITLTLLAACVSQKESNTGETVQTEYDKDGISDSSTEPVPNQFFVPEVAEEAPALYDMEDMSRVMPQKSRMKRAVAPTSMVGNVSGQVHNLPVYPGDPKQIPHNTEEYKRIYENGYVSPKVEPLSTFSIDVDVAAYANMRRFLNQSQMPYPDAVRIEEMVNYFSYDYEAPTGDDPFSIYTELSDCPWNTAHQLLHIGLQGKEIEAEDLPNSNLVFLLDVSGSMDSPSKLPLLKSAFRLLVNELKPEDRVAIVVYAGAAGMVLPSTSASEKTQILEAIEKLNAGGSTAGGEGIELAYQVAKEHFIKEGNNRVILATDGDFNVGPSSEGALVRMIEEKRKQGIFLSVLGFGTGNYKDSKMEMLADKGNGNYAYIDNILEAKKVLVSEMGGTLYTIAKDVKLQLEFNPQFVKGYRLIGYENRRLAAQDFNDDTKDAGELGSGHTVTALYEIVPPNAKTEIASVDELKYQQPAKEDNSPSEGELLTVKFRYKQPDGDKSKLIEHPVANNARKFDKTTEDFRFSLAVASFGMLLRDSEFKGDATYDAVISWAKGSKGKDAEGYRAECIRLMEKAKLLDSRGGMDQIEAKK